MKVIHCSERDTQITDQPKQVDEFVNTWSIEGFREEGTTTAEMGWGTHEKELPPLAFEHPDGPRNQICLARMGINTWVAILGAADYHIVGMVVRHGEAFTISEKLTVWEDGKAVYRPTVHYAYCPCDSAIASLHELRGHDYELQPKLRIMNDEITSGADILGALVMGHPYQSWWCGSDLSIEESRRLVPHQNATTMQVAISVVAAVHVDDRESRPRRVRARRPAARLHPRHRASRTWASSSRSPSDWTPLKHYAERVSAASTGRRSIATDPWQFKNFLVTEARLMDATRRCSRSWPRRTARRCSSSITTCCARTTGSSRSTCRACRPITPSRPTPTRRSSGRSTKRAPASTWPAWPSS